MLAMVRADPVLGAAVVVTVYEGGVVLCGRGQALAVEAGGRGALAPDGPRLLAALEDVAKERDALRGERDALLAEREGLETQLKEFMMAQAGADSPLVTENRRLTEEVAMLRRELEIERQLRGDQEGDAFAFPEDLSPKYGQEGMKAAVLDALSQSGLSGDIDAIDCTEFPCIVQGETFAPGDDDATSAVLDQGSRKMQQALKRLFPEEDNSYSVSQYGDARREVEGKVVRARRFLLSIFPTDAVDQGARKKLRRRLRWRTEQMRQSWPQEEAEEGE